MREEKERYIVSFQWNLVCDRTHYANIQQSILMFGVLLGNIIFGSLADRQVHIMTKPFVKRRNIKIWYLIYRYGRKIPLMISIVLQLLSGIGCAIVPWFQVLLLMKLLSALATGGTMVTSYVICKCLDPQIHEAIIRHFFFQR